MGIIRSVSIRVQFVLFASLVGSLTACGGSSNDGKGLAGKLDNNSPANVKFESDMDSLSKTRFVNAASVDATFQNQFSKVFGGTSASDVASFIRNRVKHVYSIDEVTNFKVELKTKEFTDSIVIKEIYEEQDLKDLLDGPTGVNFGSSFASLQNEFDADMKIHTPGGVIDVTSPRVGLVGLNIDKYSNATEMIPFPLEVRVETLAHEGRHSDCADFESEECSYAHGICPEGHEMAGLPACDKVPWGAYAVGAILLRGSLGNYDPNSLNGRILQFSYDDNISRLQPEHIEIMENSSPDLSSL